MNLNEVLPQEHVRRYFMLEGHRLYRLHQDGSATLLRSRDGQQVVTLYNNHRLRAVDIAWCLHYGRWPLFPVVQLREDPFDFDKSNLYPARIRALRYRVTQRAALFYHPLSKVGHSTAERCREHWEMLARDFYLKDLPYVMRLEEEQAALRAVYWAEHGEEAPARAPTKPSRPKPIEGREWHFVKGEWVDIPVAVHVADDWRQRLDATRAGATHFEYDHELQQVRAYLPDGTLWVPTA